MKIRVLLVAVGLALTTGCGYAGMQDLPLPGGTKLDNDSYVVTADFANVLALAEQSTVRIDGVTIGRVEKIARHGWQARVTLRLRKDVVLPSDARARVAQTSLLGEKYVDLTGVVGDGSGTLRAGDNIPISSTSRGSEVEEVLGSLSLLLNGGGVAQLKTISQEMHQALDSDSVDTRTFLRQLDTFVSTLDRNRSTIVSTLANVNRLSATINGDKGAVERALSGIAPGLKVLSSQQKQLVSMLDHLSTFGDVTSDVIRTSGADLTADLAALRPVLDELEKSGDKLPQALETILSFPFPDAVLDAVKGDYVNLAVEIDLSTGLIGNVTGGEVEVPPLDALLPGLVPKPASSALSAVPVAPAKGLLGILLDPLKGLGR